MKSGLQFFIIIMLGFFITCVAASAQQGETWRVRTTTEMQGMTLPAQTMEQCFPVGSGNTTEVAMMMLRQQNDDCQISNLRQSGNMVSADVKCAIGQNSLEGRMELEMFDDTMRGTMTAKVAGSAMTTKFENTKLGKACVVPASAKVDRVTDDLETCQMSLDMMKEMGKQMGATGLALQASVFLYPLSGPGKREVDCKQHPSFKNFCSELQTLDGFSSMDNYAGMESLPASLEICGLGSETALRAMILSQAEKEGRWNYLLRSGGDEYYSKLVALAKKECSGRSFTNIDDPKYRNLCSNYGTALVNGNRTGALMAAGCMVEVPERNICIGLNR